jgi:hypothetical protein
LQSSSVAFFARSLDQFFFLITAKFFNSHSDRPSSSRKASPHFPDSFDVHSVVVLLLVVAGRSVGSRVPLVVVWSTIILLSLQVGCLAGLFVCLFVLRARSLSSSSTSLYQVLRVVFPYESSCLFLFSPSCFLIQLPVTSFLAKIRCCNKVLEFSLIFLPDL